MYDLYYAETNTECLGPLQFLTNICSNWLLNLFNDKNWVGNDDTEDA